MTFAHRFLIASCCGVVLTGIVLVSQQASACSRVLYQSKDGNYVLVGRNMDWSEDIRSNLWVFPRGIKRDGLAAKNSLTWTAKYGSVGVSGYDVGTTDGMNEKGLSANMLWLAESEFGRRDESRPGLCVSQWLQFCLDNFATVDEAVTYFQTHDVQILWASAGDSFKKPLTVHLALGDKIGDSAVIEYVGSKAKIYHGVQACVMTNSPIFDKQLEGLKKYKGFGGHEELPGSVKAADRFVRAAFYVGRLSEPKNQRQAVAGVLSVMRNVAQPFGTSKADEPNTSQTIWRTVADLTNGVYYFESTTSPNIIWVKLKGLDFSEDAKVQKLDLVNGEDRVGDVTRAFAPGGGVQAAAPGPGEVTHVGVTSGRIDFIQACLTGFAWAAPDEDSWRPSSLTLRLGVLAGG